MTNLQNPNDKFIDPIKEAAIEAVQAVLISAISDLSKYASKVFKDYINDIYNNSRKLKEKYNVIYELYIHKDRSNLKELQNALVQTESIINLLKQDLSYLKVYNPLHTAKYQILNRRLKEWSSLNSSLNFGISHIISYEILEARITKKESTFLRIYPLYKKKY